LVAAAQQLTMALKGNIPAGNETVEALKKVSVLFTKIAEAKAAVAKAKEQRNRLRTHPDARRAIPLRRVAKQNPRVEMAIPRVDETPKANCLCSADSHEPDHTTIHREDSRNVIIRGSTQLHLTGRGGR